MDYNAQGLELVFCKKKTFNQLVKNAYDKSQDSVEEDTTVEQAIEQFKYEFDVIVSEFLAAKLLGINFDDYYESHNAEFTSDILQQMIDEENENG